MSLTEKSLDELYEYRDKLIEFVEFAKIYGGSVHLGEKVLTTEELQDKLSIIKSEIAARLSNKSYLKFIKNPGKK